MMALPTIAMADGWETKKGIPLNCPRKLDKTFGGLYSQTMGEILVATDCNAPCEDILLLFLLYISPVTYFFNFLKAQNGDIFSFFKKNKQKSDIFSKINTK